MKLIKGKAVELDSKRIGPPAPGSAIQKQVSGNARSLALGLAALLLTAPGARAQFGTQPVGATPSSQNVTVTAQAPGTVQTVEVLTLGAAGLEFAQGSGSSACATASFSPELR